MPKAPEAPEVHVDPEKVKKPAKTAPKRKAQAARKEPQPIGRRPLGIKTMSVVLQIRMTEEGLLAVRAMGGSTWARKTLEAALKRALSRGEELPRAYEKYLEKCKQRPKG